MPSSEGCSMSAAAAVAAQARMLSQTRRMFNLLGAQRSPSAPSHATSPPAPPPHVVAAAAARRGEQLSTLWGQQGGLRPIRESEGEESQYDDCVVIVHGGATDANWAVYGGQSRSSPEHLSLQGDPWWTPRISHE